MELSLIIEKSCMKRHFDVFGRKYDIEDGSGPVNELCVTYGQWIITRGRKRIWWRRASDLIKIACDVHSIGGNSERRIRLEERWAQSASERWLFEPFTPLPFDLGVDVCSGLLRVSTSCTPFFTFSRRGVIRSRTSLPTRPTFSGRVMSFEVKIRLRSVMVDDRPAASSVYVC